MSKLIIVRGLPGSGKTTRAREIAAQTGAILIEPDALMIENGVYRYTQERYREALWRCEVILEQLSLGDAIDSPRGVESDSLLADIIYADVLPRRADVRRIISLLDIPYVVEVIDCIITPEESLKRNRHNVRLEDIKRMAEDWEDWK